MEEKRIKGLNPKSTATCGLGGERQGFGRYIKNDLEKHHYLRYSIPNPGLITLDSTSTFQRCTPANSLLYIALILPLSCLHFNAGKRQ